MIREKPWTVDEEREKNFLRGVLGKKTKEGVYNRQIESRIKLGDWGREKKPKKAKSPPRRSRTNAIPKAKWKKRKNNRIENKGEWGPRCGFGKSKPEKEKKKH